MITTAAATTERLPNPLPSLPNSGLPEFGTTYAQLARTQASRRGMLPVGACSREFSQLVHQCGAPA